MERMEWGTKSPPFIPSVLGGLRTDGNGWERMGTDGKKESGKEGFFLEYFPDTFNEYEAASRGR